MHNTHYKNQLVGGTRVTQGVKQGHITRHVEGSENAMVKWDHLDRPIATDLKGINLKSKDKRFNA